MILRLFSEIVVVPFFLNEDDFCPWQERADWVLYEWGPLWIGQGSCYLTTHISAKLLERNVHTNVHGLSRAGVVPAAVLVCVVSSPLVPPFLS